MSLLFVIPTDGQWVTRFRNLMACVGLSDDDILYPQEATAPRYYYGSTEHIIGHVAVPWAELQAMATAKKGASAFAAQARNGGNPGLAMLAYNNATYIVPEFSGDTVSNNPMLYDGPMLFESTDPHALIAALGLTTESA